MADSTPLQRPVHYTAAESTALAAVEQAAGGREGLFARLSVLADLSEREQLLLAALVDPLTDRQALGTICATHGFTVGQFLALLKRGTGAKALLALHDARAVAAEEVARRLPSVAADVMLRALSDTITCPDCEGAGKHLTGKKGRPPRCQTCAGRGSITFEAGQERQELALQLGGLLPPEKGRGAPLVSVGVSAQAQAGAAAHAGRSLDEQLGGGGMSGFVTRADQALLTPGRVVSSTTGPPAQLPEPLPRVEEKLVEAPVGGVVVQEAPGLPVVRLPYSRGQ